MSLHIQIDDGEYSFDDVIFYEWDGKRPRDIPRSVFEAAPELLAACEMAATVLGPAICGEGMEARTRTTIERVLKKARGES